MFQNFSSVAFACIVSVSRKVLTYIEYRVVSVVFRTIDPPPPHRPARVYPPPHSLGGEGVGRSIVQKTPVIGLAFYSIIPLRSQCMLFYIQARSLLKTIRECTKACPILQPCTLLNKEMGSGTSLPLSLFRHCCLRWDF